MNTLTPAGLDAVSGGTLPYVITSQPHGANTPPHSSQKVKQKVQHGDASHPSPGTQWAAGQRKHCLNSTWHFLYSGRALMPSVPAGSALSASRPLLRAWCRCLSRELRSSRQDAEQADHPVRGKATMTRPHKVKQSEGVLRARCQGGSGVGRVAKRAPRCMEVCRSPVNSNGCCPPRWVRQVAEPGPLGRASHLGHGLLGKEQRAEFQGHLRHFICAVGSRSPGSVWIQGAGRAPRPSPTSGLNTEASTSCHVTCRWGGHQSEWPSGLF